MLNASTAAAYVQSTLPGAKVLAAFPMDQDDYSYFDVAFTLADTHDAPHTMSVWLENGALYGEW